jgi:hypothetical protein
MIAEPGNAGVLLTSSWLDLFVVPVWYGRAASR